MCPVFQPHWKRRKFDCQQWPLFCFMNGMKMEKNSNRHLIISSYANWMNSEGKLSPTDHNGTNEYICLFNLSYDNPLWPIHWCHLIIVLYIVSIHSTNTHFTAFKNIYYVLSINGQWEQRTPHSLWKNLQWHHFLLYLLPLFFKTK